MKKRFGLIIIVMTLVLTTVLATKDVISVKAATTKKDAKVLECQKWLNKTYKGKKGYVVIKEDGIAGGNTTKALIRAVQIQLKVEVDGSFGEGTRVKFPNLSRQAVLSRRAFPWPRDKRPPSLPHPRDRIHSG